MLINMIVYSSKVISKCKCKFTTHLYIDVRTKRVYDGSFNIVVFGKKIDGGIQAEEYLV